MQAIFVFIVFFSYMILSPARSVAINTFEKPFSASSFWNMPMNDGATYAVTGFSSANQPTVGFEEVGIHQVSLTHPLRNFCAKIVDSDRDAVFCANEPGRLDDNDCPHQINIPNDLIITSIRNNGIQVFVFPNGNVTEHYTLERCSSGSNAYEQFPTTDRDHTLTGVGDPPKGAQLGSQISALGGTIREGELSTAAGVPIDHALKLVLSVKVMTSTLPGFIWPAKRRDGTGSVYTGTNANIKMGSLLAIPPALTVSGLGIKTEPGKKIFHALRKYGGFIVDTCCNGTFQAWNFGVEIHSPPRRTVPNELECIYGITIGGTNQASVDFKSDMATIYNNLRVITNNSVSLPKGPGSPIN